MTTNTICQYSGLAIQSGRTQYCLGGRYHLYPHRVRLALLSDSAGFILAQSGWKGQYQTLLVKHGFVCSMS
ncbi:hypothetical protein [Candidatus Nitrotoga sp. HW29]|uniref:hypothetical protein n=1 Tax=Candidatus Nitrotoga sp. HW29 TaxID=2886963 RepID=UPI00403D9A51